MKKNYVFAAVVVFNRFIISCFQLAKSKNFQMFDYGAVENMKKYNQVRQNSILVSKYSERFGILDLFYGYSRQFIFSLELVSKLFNIMRN